MRERKISNISKNVNVLFNDIYDCDRIYIMKSR